MALTTPALGHGIRTLSLLAATGALVPAQTTHVVSGGGAALQNAIATAVGATRSTCSRPSARR